MNDMAKVSLEILLKYGSLIEKETYWKLMDFYMSGAKTVNVPDGTIEKLEAMKKARKLKPGK